MIHEQTEEMAAPQRRRGALLVAKLFFGGALAFFGACVIYTATLPMGPSENVRAVLDAPIRVEPTAGIGTAPAARKSTRSAARKPVVRKTRRAAPVQRKTVRVPKAPVRPKVRKTSVPRPTETRAVTTFKNCAALNKVYPAGVPVGHPAYERKHDRDKDNRACEQ